MERYDEWNTTSVAYMLQNAMSPDSSTRTEAMKQFKSFIDWGEKQKYFEDLPIINRVGFARHESIERLTEIYDGFRLISDPEERMEFLEKTGGYKEVIVPSYLRAQQSSCVIL